MKFFNVLFLNELSLRNESQQLHINKLTLFHVQ